MDMGEGKLMELESLDHIYNQILNFKHATVAE